MPHETSSACALDPSGGTERRQLHLAQLVANPAVSQAGPTWVRGHEEAKRDGLATAVPVLASYLRKRVSRPNFTPCQTRHS